MTHSRKYPLAVVLLVLLGILPRLAYLDTVELNIDYLYPYWQATRTLTHNELPVVGQWSSVFVANPALMGYLLFPLVAFFPTPFAALFFIATLNSLAIPFTWLIARRLLAPWSALVATFLVAVNPWVIEFSRTSWVQSLWPFGVTLLLALLVPVLLGEGRQRTERTIAAAVTLTALTQMYILSFVILLPVGLLLLRFWRRVPPRGLAIGALCFLIPTTIFLVALSTHPHTSAERMDALVSRHWEFRRSTAEHAMRFATGDSFAYARATHLTAANVRLRQWLDDTVLVLPLLAILLGTLDALRAAPGRERERQFIILVWLAPAILLMSYTPTVIHIHYLLYTLPAAALLAARGFSLLARPGWARLGVTFLVGMLGGILLFNSLARLEETRTHLTNDELILALRDGVRVAERLNAQPGEILIADTQELLYEAYTRRDLRQEDTSSYIDYPRAIIARGAPTTYLLLNQAELPYRRMENIPITGGNSVQVVHVSPGEVEYPMDIASDQGLRLRGYNLDGLEAGNVARVQVAWEVERVVENAFFEPFIHLYDDTGERVAVVHGSVIPAFEWQVGDWQLYTLEVELPPGTRPPFRLETGLYNPIERFNAMLFPEGIEASTTVPLE